MTEQDQYQPVRTVWWEESPEPTVRLLDQALLPQQVVYLRLVHESEVADAIATLKVRGAPVIGVTAAFGVALALRRLVRESDRSGSALTLAEARAHIQVVCQLLGRTRPTAVNLFWALERMRERALQASVATVAELADLLLAEAHTIAAEDVLACAQMGQYGADLIADGDVLLTHCNAGLLAATGLGTALAPIYTAHQAGKHVHVYVDETRPILQGARLTAWELQQAGVPLTLITDNMAAYFMLHGGIKAIFVGADRIAANGDVANKIGTYGLAVLAQAHAIPFYVVAPCSTIDHTLSSGALIPIEQRDAAEVTAMRGIPLAPAGVAVANPAFDVTPHRYVSAIITEKGIARAPYDVTLRQKDLKNIITGKV